MTSFQIQSFGGVYANMMGTAVDPYEYFSERGCNMVRIRLWNTPENYTDFCGNPIQANNMEDVITTFQRAKAADMRLNLSIHNGDSFNDPSTQQRPWRGQVFLIMSCSIPSATIHTKS